MGTCLVVSGCLGLLYRVCPWDPWEKFDISGIIVNFFANFTVLTEEDSDHTLC